MKENDNLKRISILICGEMKGCEEVVSAEYRIAGSEMIIEDEGWIGSFLCKGRGKLSGFQYGLLELLFVEFKIDRLIELILNFRDFTFVFGVQRIIEPLLVFLGSVVSGM